MSAKPPFSSVGHVGISWMAALLLALASTLCARAATTLSYTADYYGSVKVTCKLAYYAQFTSDGHAIDGGIRLTLADPPRANTAAMKTDGSVMEVHTPKELAGKTICIWLDRPVMQANEAPYKAGARYAGHWPTLYIGTLTFKGEVPFERVAKPSRRADGSQPSSSVTKRVSAAAGSRGSR